MHNRNHHPLIISSPTTILLQPWKFPLLFLLFFLLLQHDFKVNVQASPTTSPPQHIQKNNVVDSHVVDTTTTPIKSNDESSGNDINTNNNSNMNNDLENNNIPKYKYRVLQAHIIHRHGDRSPLTPMKDENYWSDTLPSVDILNRLAVGTKIVRDDDDNNDTDDTSSSSSNNNIGNKHAARGIGPFGKLTTMGLMRMVGVGSELRDALCVNIDDNNNDNEDNNKNGKSDNGDDNDNKKIHRVDKRGNVHLYNGRIFTIGREDKLYSLLPLFHPSELRIRSTDFERTIQSTYAVLAGLFPDGLSSLSPTTTTTAGVEESVKAVVLVPIDVRETSTMIPDPQPRSHLLQPLLERDLDSRSHLVEKDRTVAQPLAKRMSEALKSLLAVGAVDSPSYGIGDDGGGDENTRENDTTTTTTTTTSSKKFKYTNIKETKIASPVILPMTRVSEVLTALRARDAIPLSISNDDVDAANAYVAWRWLENLSDPTLACISMGTFAESIIDGMQSFLDDDIVSGSDGGGGGGEEENEELLRQGKIKARRLHLYSAHDSTLLGLICAFRLNRRPGMSWPEYGSHFKIELIEAVPLTPRYDNDHSIDDIVVRNPHEVPEYLVRFSLNGETLRCRWGRGCRKGDTTVAIVMSDYGSYDTGDIEPSDPKEASWEMVPLKKLRSDMIREHYQLRAEFERKYK